MGKIKTSIFLSLLFFSLGAAGQAFAATNGFTRLDTDQNGVIDRSEWPGKTTSFRRLDRNNNGLLTKNEYFNRKKYSNYTYNQSYDSNDYKPAYSYNSNYNPNYYPNNNYYNPASLNNPTYNDNPGYAYNPIAYNPGYAPYNSGYGSIVPQVMQAGLSGFNNNPYNNPYLSKNQLRTQAAISLVGSLANTIMTLR